MTTDTKKLTIGMVVHDDYDGAYFTLQSIRLYNPELLKNIEFIIIDNNPNSISGKALAKLTKWITQPLQYIPFTEYKSTAIRNKIFDYAKTDYVLCTDCHVMFEPGSLLSLFKFFNEKKDNDNLLHGPLLYDDLKSYSTHFDLVWRSHMWGVWGTDKRAENPNNEPFEIPAMGLGVFACRKSAWLGFNPLFRGFGGEEGYIHEKYRKAGRKTLCLPFLRWIHRFERPRGVTYPLRVEDRIRNYIIGFTEVGLNINDIKNHFINVYPEEKFNELRDKTMEELKAIN